jgi:hypothetical protein
MRPSRFAAQPVEEAFFDSAPLRLREAFEIPRTAARVWEELTADSPLSWCRLLRSVTWTSPRPFGAGTTRTVHMLGNATILDERFFRWEEGRRKSFYVVESNLPLFRVPGRGLSRRAHIRGVVPLHVDGRNRASPRYAGRESGQPPAVLHAVPRHAQALRVCGVGKVRGHRSPSRGSHETLGQIVGLMTDHPADALDEALCRAHELFLDDCSDSADAELARLLPALVKAGYVTKSGHSSTGSFWAFTEAGIERANVLGCDC